jgi:Cu+-exporting ATPase
MHREISRADQIFYQERNLPLYLLTALIGLLIGLDLWPAFADWAGIGLTWSQEIYPGYRIALIAAIIGGARVLFNSFEQLLEGKWGADLALAVACVAAILFGKPLVAAEIVFIGMLGECLESITFERTQRAIRKIVEVFPHRCWVLRQGQEVRVLTTEVQVGERVVVKPGARIPVDGVVVEGRSSVDASALTGESVPVDKGTGDEALAGTLNQFGALTIEARRVAESTVVGRVIELTRTALKDKMSLERTADRLARYFLPVVLGLALCTFLVALLLNWGIPSGTKREFAQAVSLSINPTLAVLVVACPCALILATPAAVMAALGRLAGTGVLVKGGSALERLAQVKAFVFDKTGTLTEGKLELGEILTLPGITDSELLRLAAAAEQKSEHFLARLILEEAARRQIKPEPAQEFQAYPGSGVSAQTSLGTILVGTRQFLEDKQIQFPYELQSLMVQLDRLGQTAIIVARDGIVAGVVGVRDRVRSQAAGVLRDLCHLGIERIAMLTGDRLAAAKAIAADLEISEIHAELLPNQKADFIKTWQQNHKVAMVGDGINDAPALATADVGLAVGGTGTDIAAEAGDVVLMGDPLRPLPLLLGVSWEMVRIIRQNIILFAFGVNALGILLTAWLWPILFSSSSWQEEGPLAAVIYHQLGSLAVLFNSMRLLWFGRTASSPMWSGARHRLQTIDLWLNHALDFDEWLHWASHHLRPVALSVLGLCLALYALSGMTQIGPDEIGVVRRFGRPITPDLNPGLHWRWPWPVEQVIRLQPDRVRTVEIGFRPLNGGTPQALAWSSSHGGEGIERRPEEAIMITGDGNLVELQASFRYTVSDPHAYFFDVETPDDVIRSAGEAAIRETIAGRTFLELLTRYRDSLANDVLKRLNQRLQMYGNLGVTLQGLDLHDLHPPFDVVPDYRRVTMAMESRDRQINEAEAEKLRVYSDARLPGKRAAQVKQNQMLNVAAADREQKIKEADAARQAFQDRLEARSALSASEEWQLLQNTVEAIHSGQDVASAFRDYETRRMQRIKLSTTLTDFRLYWDALAQALSGREKILVDTDKVPGRRQLLLFDPDLFRVPTPVLTPQGPNSMRR